MCYTTAIPSSALTSERRWQAGGKIGGKRSLETMTPEERSARAKKASEAAAQKRTAARLAKERAAKRAESGIKHSRTRKRK